MAFDASQDQSQDDVQQTNQQTNQAAGQQSQLSGGGGFAGQSGASSAGASSSSAAPSAGAPGTYNQTPTNSGSWTNLNSYLNANSDQSAAVGQGIANAVGTQASQAQSDLGNVVQGFDNQTPFANLNNTTSANVDQAFSNPSQYASSTSGGVTTAPSTTTPENYLNNNWGINSTNSDITQYAPTSTTTPSWGSVQSEYQNAAQSLADTQSESGRDVLLQNQYGVNGSQYTPGEQSFDQLLLEQNPSNQSALQNVYNQYAPSEVVSPTSTTGLSSDLSNALTNSQNYVTNEQAAATGFQNQANTDLTNQISSLGQNLTGETSADSSNYQNAYNQILQGLNSDNLSAAQYQQLGLTPGSQTYGANPAAFLAQSANPYSGTQAANYAATAGDWNNFSGLQNLLAGDSNSNQATNLQQLAANGLTGTQATAPTAANPYSFNVANYNAAQAADQQAYQQAYTNTGLTGVSGGYVNANGSTYTGGLSASQLSDLLNGIGTGGVAIDPSVLQSYQAALQAFNTAQGNQILGNPRAFTPIKPVGGGGGGGSPTPIGPVTMS